MNPKIVSISLVLLLLLWGCGESESVKKVSLLPQPDASPPATEPCSTVEPVLYFGFDLRLSPKEDVRIYAPFLKYLEAHTGFRFGIRFTQGYEDTAANLARGVIQFAALGPVNCILAQERFGIGCLVMGLNLDNRPEYHSVIFTRPDSPLKQLEDLRSATFAFGDRFSTQGHVLPRHILETAGINLSDLKDHTFSGSHIQTARLVINGWYDAGGMQDTLAHDLAAEGKIRILAVSDPSPSSLVCYHPNVDTAVLSKIKAVLLAFDPTSRDAPHLVNWHRTEMPRGFMAYDAAALLPIRNMMEAYGLLTP